MYDNLPLSHPFPTIVPRNHQFTTQTRFSEAYHMAQMRDELLTYMNQRRLWKRLGTLRRRSIAAIRILSIPQKTDRPPVSDEWLPHISCWNMGVHGRLFEIIRLSGGGLQRSAAEFLKHQELSRDDRGSSEGSFRGTVWFRVGMSGMVFDRKHKLSWRCWWRVVNELTVSSQ